MNIFEIYLDKIIKLMIKLNNENLIQIDFFKEIYKSHKKKIKSINNDILIYQMIRDSINLMVKDLVKNTMKNLKIKKAKSVHDIYSCKDRLVCFSNKFMKIEEEIKYFLRTRMYDNKSVLIKNNKGKKSIRKLFDEIYSNPRKYLSKEQLKLNKHRVIADFISGMTDRYAINLYNKIK